MNINISDSTPQVKNWMAESLIESTLSIKWSTHSICNENETAQHSTRISPKYIPEIPFVPHSR